MKATAVLLASVLAFSSNAQADRQTVGDWVVTGSEAFTVNDSGSQFGFLCSDGSCVAYLDTKTACEDDATIPMVINSDSGAAYVLATCIHIKRDGETRYVSAIQDKDVATAITTGSAIGFAIPMVGGQFKVVRFSLSGAVVASQRALAAMQGAAPPKKSTFKDTTM